ncbi:alpha/beta fold hydrolase [Streptomyces sp. TP-A0356]|uniref:alpha/beta fold hydrolase n=1 Tax=Streptomyces sp. TP-A0356 TaxID=1359208 RepID=UPI000A826DF0|nr:alpha/beta hydrolase [Streptomyces sp. TP-A0356]
MNDVSPPPRPGTGLRAEVPHTLTRDGACLHYWTAGPPTAPLVALTHGAGADHRMFDPQIPALLAAGYRTLRWDVRHHGLSVCRNRRFRVLDAADDLRALLETCPGPWPVVLLGQSIGGNIAQEYLRRRPDDVAALVVIGSTSNTLPVSRAQRAQLALSRPLLRMLPYRRLAARMAVASARTPEARAHLREVFLRMGRRGFLTVWEGMTRTLTQDPDYLIDRPQLLLCGQYDSTGNVRSAMERWNRRDPRSGLRVLPDAGHVANLDRPDLVNRMIVDFLSGLRTHAE